jgi:(5-formylfuran-3-yl)methyl phosphate synthase
VASVREFKAGVKVVVCGYADAGNYGFILPKHIPDIVAKAGADIAMIDTLRKGNGKGLFDYLDELTINTFCSRARKLRIKVALAGNLTKNDILRIMRKNYCDIVGIRSLACRGGKRNNIIESSRVKEIRKLIIR